MRDRLRSSIENLGAKDLLQISEQKKEKITRTEWILLDDIVISEEEEGMIDKNRAQLLANELIESGQDQGIYVRARWDPDRDRIVYDIGDGYNRAYGLQQIYKNPPSDKRPDSHKIKAEVVYGLPDQDLMARRILAANNISTVAFARRGVWMTRAWKLTEWGDKVHVHQAFALANSDSSGRKLGIMDNAQEIKEWVKKQCKTWNMAVPSAYSILKIHHDASPKLVMRVRSGSFGKGLLSLTKDQLRIISEAMPRNDRDEEETKENFAAQETIANFATRNSLSTRDLSCLVANLADINYRDPEKLKSFLSSQTWKDTSINIPQSGRREYPPLPKNIPTLGETVQSQTGQESYPTRSATAEAYKQADRIVTRWIEDDKNRLRLRKDSGTQTVFVKEVSSLNTLALGAAAELSMKRILSSKPNTRDGVIELIGRLPIDKLGTESTTSILVEFNKTLKNVFQENELPDIKTFSFIIESVADMLDKITYLKRRSPDLWNEILDTLDELTRFCDPSGRVYVQEWMTRIVGKL